MGIERAVVKGTIASEVEIRNIFTGEVTEVGGDTSAILWETYVDQFLAAATQMLHSSVHFYGYDVYEYVLGQWSLIDEVSVDFDGQISGEAILNAAALVLLGKAAGIRHVGRKFLGALAESGTVSNVLGASLAVDAAATLLTYISPVTGIGGGTLQPGVIDQGGFFHAFVGGAVSSLLGTMRRRKPGVGI